MTQEQSLDILKTGANIFLTGEPGSGKTFVLNQYIEWLEDCGISVAVTASTGIAATHIGGMTIHSWSWIGARDTLSAYDVDNIAGKEKVAKRIRNAKVLVIDEISMLDGKLLDMVDLITRTIRTSGDPFGGLQIVLVGDFFQLPPIAGRGELPQFAFESGSWERARFLTCYLTEQYRQEDEMLLGLLNSIRKNETDETHYTLLSEQKDIAYEDIEPTKLFTHNKDVDAINITKLKELSGETRTFTMEAGGNKQRTEGLIKSCLSPEKLQLKLESMVMCTKNNFDVGYVNGTLGRVIGYDTEDGFPIIETSDEREIKITPMSWSVEEEGKVLAEITQVPLRLAWAITVHKSQGMSLDAAEIDLRNAFAYGQGYVALSRVRTLAGMKVLGLNANALQVDPRIVHKDEQLQQQSMQAEEVFQNMDAEELQVMHKNFVGMSGGKLPVKGEKRLKRNKAERLKRESTFEITKELVLKGKSVSEISKERKMALSTIWGHIEKLSDEGNFSKNQLSTLIPHDVDWESSYQELSAAMDEVGTEKLKPIHEKVGEKYDYDLVRLGRLLYTLK